jgi:hypothetical protein
VYEEAAVDVNELNDQLAWALLAAGLAVVLLGAVPFLRDARAVRGASVVAMLLGVVAVVLAIIRVAD